MEFLRFGSSIPGSYWGCCAMCIIQDFKQDPDAKASIELVCGDGGQPIGDSFAGKTWKEIFETRLRIGTFNDDDMPNHGFLAILTAGQVTGSYGYAWLKILKDSGFEFIRAVSNSVYAGPTLAGTPYCSECESETPCDDDDWCSFDDGENNDQSLNYLFGLFRNIGNGKVTDQFEPPRAWTELDGGVKGAHDFITPIQRNKIMKSQDKVNLEVWNDIGSPTFYTQQELKDADVPIYMAGLRSNRPQQLLSAREEAIALEEKSANKPAKASPLPSTDALTEVKPIVA